jgi:translation initiation factor IF-3
LGAPSGEDLQVRVLIDPLKPGEPSTSEMLSLTQAVKKSLEIERDLIAVSIDQEVPVIKIADAKSLVYQQSKKQSENKKKSKSLPAKEIRFRTRIAENDLQRKVDQMCKYLDKGHNCLITVRASRRNAMKDPEGTVQTVTQIMELIKDDAELMNDPKVNLEKTVGQFQVRPAPKKK